MQCQVPRASVPVFTRVPPLQSSQQPQRYTDSNPYSQLHAGLRVLISECKPDPDTGHTKNRILCVTLAGQPCYLCLQSALEISKTA